MKAIPLAIPDVVLMVPTLFQDNRGYFFESFNERVFRAATGTDSAFVQDNQSRSKRNVLRGLHFQLDPKAQGKLVRATSGTIFDVAVDIRPTSATCGNWVAAELSADNHHQLWIPPGFAHGFLTLSETAEVLYKTTDYWAAGYERCIRWDDPVVGIDWPLRNAPIVSQKDAIGSFFEDLVFGVASSKRAA